MRAMSACALRCRVSAARDAVRATLGRGKREGRHGCRVPAVQEKPAGKPNCRLTVRDAGMSREHRSWRRSAAAESPAPYRRLSSVWTYGIPIKFRDNLWLSHMRHTPSETDVWHGTLALMVLTILEALGGRAVSAASGAADRDSRRPPRASPSARRHPTSRRPQTHPLRPRLLNAHQFVNAPPPGGHTTRAVGRRPPRLDLRSATLIIYREVAHGVANGLVPARRAVPTTALSLRTGVTFHSLPPSAAGGALVFPIVTSSESRAV